MAEHDAVFRPLRVADLPQNIPFAFALRPDAAACAALGAELDLLALRKLSFVGELRSEGRKDWVLDARLGATVVQPCGVTLDPVTTRIDTDVRRYFAADYADPTGDEVEMPEDDSIEPLGAEIDPARIMAEALALALPAYPRSANAPESAPRVFSPPGTAPLDDDALRPFAGLAALRDQMKDGD